MSNIAFLFTVSPFFSYQVCFYEQQIHLSISFKLSVQNLLVWPKKAFTKACQNHFNTQLNRPLGGICDAFKIPTFGKKKNWGNFLSF